MKDNNKYWVQLSIHIDCISPGVSKYNAMQIALAAFESGEMDQLLRHDGLINPKDNPAVHVSVQGLRQATSNDDNDICKFHIGGQHDKDNKKRNK